MPVTSVIQRGISRGLSEFLQSYDIVCRWGINYVWRISQGQSLLLTPEELQSAHIKFAVPSMHIRGHEPSCADQFGQKYMANVGRNHGEGSETIWPGTNRLQETVRSSGFGARRDLLTDHFLHWNRGKISKMGEFYIHILCVFSIRPQPL